MNIKLTSGTLNTYLNDKSIFDFLIENLSFLKGNVLDIGCGKMKYKNTILSNKNVNSYTGLDLDPGKFVYSVKADIYWDGEKMPIEENSYDSIIIFEVLEHCYERKKVIKEAYRVLKPGGYILFTTPFLYPLHGIPYDFNRPTPYTLSEEFREIGFRKIEIIPGGGIDASLGQMFAIWISARKMPEILRKVIRKLYIPIFKFLLYIDKKSSNKELNNGTMITNLLGKAQK